MFILNSTNLKSLINSVYLNGTITECVIDIKEGKGKIQSIDKMNCMFVSNDVEITEDQELEIQLGLRDLSMLTKILSGIKEDVRYEISKDNKWLHLSIKGKGKIKLLLIEPDTLVTAVTEEGVSDKLMENTRLEVLITDKIKEDILYFLNLFKTKVVEFCVTKNRLYLKSHCEDINQFEIPIAKVKSKDISVEVNGLYLATILSFIEKSNEPKFHIGEDTPILISSEKDTENYMWALSPISME